MASDDFLSLQKRVSDLERKRADRSEFIDVVTLKTGDGILSGKYRTEAEHVLVLLDAKNGSFKVTLPDAKTSRNIIFIWKKIDETTNAVTLVGKGSNLIHGIGAPVNEYTITTVAPINSISDRKNTWIIAG